MTRSVSILIPTHDRAEILERSLESLREVRRPEGVTVEAVVIANACSDSTEETVRSKTASFPFPLRLVSEPTPGLNPARNAGARAARGEILAYLDDDAFVEPGWLEGLVRCFERYPADLVAGRVVLWWEALPRPDWVSPPVERLLSRLDLGDEPRPLPGPSKVVGANFALRREVLEAVGAFSPHLDRSGKELLSGGDTELAHRIQRAGYRLYYCPEMSVRHWVAPPRLAGPHLDRLARARGRTRVAVAASLGAPPQGRLLKQGLAQIVRGGWQELSSRLFRDRRRAVAGRLNRLRGVGKVEGVLRDLVRGRRAR